MTCQQRCNARLPTHTDGAENAKSTTGSRLMNERKETLSNSNDHLSNHNDMCQRFEGYRSQYSDKASDTSGASRTPVKGAVSRTP